MTTCTLTNQIFGMTSGWVKPSAVKFCELVGTGSYSETRTPTDPIGTFTLTLTNVVTGSALQVESQAAGTTLYNGTAASSSPVIVLSTYAGGGSNDLNNLRIKVRKGSAAPYYKPFETLTTAFVGSQSIYCAQIPD